MGQELDSIDQLKESLDAKGVTLGAVNVLFLDMSSTCTGYTLAKVDFEHKKATFLNTGAIWFQDDMSNQDKYHYIFSAITNYFNIVGQMDLCVAEAYMINSKKKMGSQVGPELHGALQVALAEIGVKYWTILPQSWRAALGIKADVTLNNKGVKEKDFKTPTRNYVSKIATIPSQVESNVTKNLRNTPDDIFDSMAIAMGFLTKLGITKWDCKDLKVQEPIDMN